MTVGAGYIVEDLPEGRSLVVTGAWSRDAAEVLERGDVEGLILNYARGFSEENLEFLDSWHIRRLKVLDRQVTDLSPIERLGDSLEELSVQAAPSAELDLRVLPRVRSLAAEWGLICGTLGAVDSLERVVTWRFDESDLHSFRDHVGLQRLTIKEAPQLKSLSGLGNLPDVVVLSIFMARHLTDIGGVADLASSIEEFELEDCPSIGTIRDVEPLVNLRFLGVSECGDIESLAPLAALTRLEIFHAWGSTRVLDADLSPLARLPHLTEIRMRNRRGYEPSVDELVSSLAA